MELHPTDIEILFKEAADKAKWEQIKVIYADQIKQLFLDTIEKVKPEEIDEGEGWDIFFSDGIDDDGKARTCCPGDDIAYVHNKVVNDFTTALKKEIGK